MSDSVIWFCIICNHQYSHRQQLCDDCNVMLYYKCISSNQSGLYSNYSTHVHNCIYCNAQNKNEIFKQKKKDVEEKNTSIILFEKGNITFSSYLQFISIYSFANYYLFIYLYVLFILESSIWKDIRNKELLLKEQTGHTLEEIQFLYNSISTSLLQYRRKRELQKENDKYHYNLSPHTMLFLTLYYYRQYHTTRYISAQYNISRRTLRRIIDYVTDNLFLSFVPPMFQFIPANLPAYEGTNSALQSVKLIIDASIVAINQPEDLTERRQYYTSKAEMKYGIKFQIAVDLHEQILHASNAVQGSIHDRTLLMQTNLFRQLNENFKALADKAYISMQNVVTPIKKPRAREYNETELLYNAELSSVRARVENVFEKIKRYRIVGDIYRGNKHDLHTITKYFHIICSFINLHIQFKSTEL